VRTSSRSAPAVVSFTPGVKHSGLKFFHFVL
jgi:hypothetical protein